MPKAAVIGCGDVSAVHFEALAGIDGADLVAVCDPDPQPAGGAGSRPRRPRLCRLPRPHRGGPRPTSCTSHPASTNTPRWRECLRRGHQRRAGKAPGPHPGRGRKAAGRGCRSTAKIAVCFQNRYNATVAGHGRAAVLRRAGAGGGGVGHGHVAALCRYYLSRPWRGTWAGGGGGLMMNQAIHTVDLLQWLVGDVVAVSRQRLHALPGRHHRGGGHRRIRRAAQPAAPAASSTPPWPTPSTRRSRSTSSPRRHV